MAKLFFNYSTMNAGKSTILLQAAHNYEEKGMVLLEEEKLERVKRMQIFLMNKEKNFGHQEGFPIPMKKNYDWYSC